MMEQSHRKSPTIPPIEETLPGLGPKVEVDELEIRLDPKVIEHPDADSATFIIELMHAQRDRYDWFEGRIDAVAPVHELGKVLMGSAEGPGELEAALVSLSLSTDPMAAVVLQTWEPPEHDLHLALLHQICVAKCLLE